MIRKYLELRDPNESQSSDNSGSQNEQSANIVVDFGDVYFEKGGGYDIGGSEED